MSFAASLLKLRLRAAVAPHHIVHQFQLSALPSSRLIRFPHRASFSTTPPTATSSSSSDAPKPSHEVKKDESAAKPEESKQEAKVEDAKAAESVEPMASEQKDEVKKDEEKKEEEKKEEEKKDDSDKKTDWLWWLPSPGTAAFMFGVGLYVILCFEILELFVKVFDPHEFYI